MTAPAYVGQGDAIFKVETRVGMSHVMVQMFISKREAKGARSINGSTSRVRRGPNHRRGETGVTTHDWNPEIRMWRRLPITHARIVGSLVRSLNAADARTRP